MGVDVVGQVGGVEDREDVPADRRLEDGEVLHLPEEAHGHPRAARDGRAGPECGYAAVVHWRRQLGVVVAEVPWVAREAIEKVEACLITACRFWDGSQRKMVDISADFAL